MADRKTSLKHRANQKQHYVNPNTTSKPAKRTSGTLSLKNNNKGRFRVLFLVGHSTQTGLQA